ncbi:MAG TPA: hypothetical protein VIV60_09935, partial [Polyangiaceae bacterium]
MSPDPNKKIPRQFQCRESLWQRFEQMARELECSVDYLINDAMKQYARQRGYAGASSSQRAETMTSTPANSISPAAPVAPAEAPSSAQVAQASTTHGSGAHGMPVPSTAASRHGSGAHAMPPGAAPLSATSTSGSGAHAARYGTAPSLPAAPGPVAGRPMPLPPGPLAGAPKRVG